LIGLLITVCFVFVPKIYDPIIMKALPIESIDKDEQLVDYLASIQNRDNVIIGVHGYIHSSPISGKTICEYYCPGEDITSEIVKERVEKGNRIFEKSGLNAPWIAPTGESYDDKFLNTTKELGYITEPYCIESYGGFQNELEMVIKIGALEKINKFKNKGKEPILTVDFSADSSSGKVPLKDVGLIAYVSGTATGDITYKFDCTDDGTWEKIQVTDSTSHTASDLCDYTLAGIYTTKVKIEREGVQVEGTTQIIVLNPDGKLTTPKLVLEEMNAEELKSKIKETETLIERFKTQLAQLPTGQETPEDSSEIPQGSTIIFKEYTWEWREKTLASIQYDDSDEYQQAKKKLKEDVEEGLNGILLHIQDFNDLTEKFLQEAFQDYPDIKFVRVDDIASSYDLSRLEKFVNLTRENNRLTLIAVIPAHLSSVGNARLSPAIKTTWVVFVSFFLFPIAVMAPLHWYERGKVRKTQRRIPGSPKVSLIFPAYNEEKFIDKSIEQGLKQDYRGELEIVIIDDGSTDRTFEIASHYASSHSNVKIYKHTVNSGKPAALNTGFQKATGEISIFSDTDSYLDSDLVSRMVSHFDDPKVGAVAGMIIVDNEINLLTKLQQIEYLYNQEIIRFCQAVHKGVLICPGAATAVRTQIARDIPSTERTVTEDADFTFEVAKAGWKVGQEPEAISRTDVPENWKELINQRRRWLYGVLQTIWIHKWAIFFKGTKIPNLWVGWAWIGYATCPITTLAVLAIPLFTWLIGPSYLIFLGFYSLVIAVIYGFAHWYGIKQYTHENKTKLAFLLPLYMVYQYLLNVLLFYLIIAFILRKGITVRYGGRDIHAV